jgi:hypothetical protein
LGAFLCFLASFVVKVGVAITICQSANFVPV